MPTSVGYGASFGGLAALLGMLNSCATGLAVVNIDNGFGAGYFAHLINVTSGVHSAAGADLASADAGRKGGERALTPGPSPELRGGETKEASSLVPPPLSSGEGARGWGPALQPGAVPMTAPEHPSLGSPQPPSVVTVMEANLDDLNPQVYEHVMERLFEAGALDVTLTPIQMKKNRPGVTVSVICDPERAGALAEVLFEETTTLGLRMSRWERLCLEREWVTAETPWGAVRVKIGRREGRVVTRTPEYEECRRVAREAGVPLKEVQAAALAAVVPPTAT